MRMGKRKEKKNSLISMTATDFCQRKTSTIEVSRIEKDVRIN